MSSPTPRLWDVTIQINAFQTPRTETWDVIEIFRWSEKTLAEMEPEEVVRKIYERIRLLYS